MYIHYTLHRNWEIVFLTKRKRIFKDLLLFQDYRREEADEDNVTYDMKLGRRIAAGKTKAKKTGILITELVWGRVGTGKSQPEKNWYANYLSNVGYGLGELSVKSGMLITELVGGLRTWKTKPK